MKKISLFLLSILIGFYVISCSEKHVDPIEKLADLEKIEMFKKLSKSEMKVAYSSLSKYDKYFFWKQHTLEYLSANKLSEQQTSLIEELLEQASPEIFIINSEANLDFKNFISKWEIQAQSAFPRNRGFAIITSDDNNPNLRAPATTCNCANNSVFISDCENDEDECLIAPSPGCVETEDREDGGGGCGFWWLSSCDKICR